MNRHRLSLCLFVALLLGAVSPAGAGQALSLKEALALAMEGNLEVLSAREERARAEGLYRAARSGLVPTVSLTGSHSRQHATSSRPDEETTGALTLSQWIYAGGVVRAGERQALANLERAVLTVSDREETVALKVYEAFCSVLLARADLETAREALTYAEGFLAELTKRREVGLSTNLDVNRAEQQAATSRSDLLQATNALDAARIDLFTLLRLDPDAERDIVGDLEMDFFSVDLLTRLRLEPSGERDVAGDSERESFAAAREASVERALALRPDLVGLRTDLAVQKEEIEIIRGGLRPTVKLNASYGVKDDSSLGGADNDEWTATLNVDVPLFDGGLTKGKVEEAQARLRQIENDVTSQEEAIRAEIAQAYLNLESAAALVDVARRNLGIAEESLRLADVGYREGVNVQLDVLDARTSLTEARQKLAEALKNYRVYRARLWRAEGALREKVLD